MSLSLYKHTGSFFERVHPVTKTVGLVLAFVPPFLGGSPNEILPYFILLLLAAALGRSWSGIRRVATLMLILFVMSLVLWSIFHPGQTVLFQLGPAKFYKESLNYGVTVGLRLNCFIVATVIFLVATPIEDFTFALLRLGLPFGPSFALTLAFRLTPLFIDTGQTIVMAQKARGLDLDSGGPLTRIRKHAPIIVPVLISGLRKGDQLAMALEARGFGSGRTRSFAQEYAVTWRDTALMAAIAAAGVLMGFKYFA